MVRNGHFTICPMLTADQFIDYCKERDIKVTIEHLERYERLGVFMPMARVRYPKVKTKIVRNDNSSDYTEIGPLEIGEDWAGEIREWRAVLYWIKDSARKWMEEGLLWEPKAGDFQPWANFEDEQGETIAESFYSIFQTFHLYSLMCSTALPRLGMDQIISFSEEDMKSWIARWVDDASRIITVLAEDENALDQLARLCQIISTRYYPHAKSDGLTISIPAPDFGFNWESYRRQWDAHKVMTDIGLTLDEVASSVELVASEAETIDPLSRWQDFVRFFRPSKKSQLKGNALFAQTGYVMERMLNLFHRDLTGKEIYLFDSSPEDVETLYGQGVTQDDLRYLELLSNEFNVNPRPRLVLAVEGKGEFEQLPRLAKDLFGWNLSKLRIGLINLSGVEGFTGRKRQAPYGALEKLIDYYHYMQTIVFVILDDEARVSIIRDRLVKARSKFHPNRTVTKDEYIHLWTKNIEFDNFTHAEIARALTEVSAEKYSFSESEIADCERRFGREGDPLSKLYSKTLNYDLVKPELLKVLFGYAIEAPHTEVESKKTARPIVDVMRNVIRLSLRNNPPSYLDAWEQTQNSDWLGTPL